MIYFTGKNFTIFMIYFYYLILQYFLYIVYRARSLRAAYDHYDHIYLLHYANHLISAMLDICVAIETYSLEEVLGLATYVTICGIFVVFSFTL